MYIYICLHIYIHIFTYIYIIYIYLQTENQMKENRVVITKNYYWVLKLIQNFSFGNHIQDLCKKCYRKLRPLPQAVL